MRDLDNKENYFADIWGLPRGKAVVSLIGRGSKKGRIFTRELRVSPALIEDATDLLWEIRDLSPCPTKAAVICAAIDL